MQVLQRWRNVLSLNSIAQSTRLAAATHFASLHSSNALFEKWENNLDSPRISYTVREKRAGARKDLKAVLYNGGCSTSRHEITGDYADQLNKKSRIKPAHHSKRAAHKKLKRKPRRESLFDDHDDDPAKAFFAAFAEVGSNWTYRHWGKGSECPGNSDWSDSKTDSHNNIFTLGTCADRKILGLPTTGPLKIQDVKAAFRSSALKWHPDRHQCSSQAAAEDKFKQCVDAYKSLCKNLSPR